MRRRSGRDHPPERVAAVSKRQPAQRRRTLIIAAVAIPLVLAGSGLAAATALSAAPPPAGISGNRPSTVPIEFGTLSGSRTVAGVLDYAETHDLESTLGGVLTQLPTPGSIVGLGGELYRVDNSPVYLLRGSIPAWRGFDWSMSDGPDVTQLEASLRDLGFFEGEPDSEFDWCTSSAIEAWQEATGQPETGGIDFGRIVFAPADIRVGESKSTVGDSVGGGSALYRASGLTKQVTGSVKLADQVFAQVGAVVQISLPGGRSTTGTVESVGQPEEREENGSSSVIIPITVRLDDPSAVEDLQRANVTMQLPSDIREDVLSVPLDALLALPGGGFGIEIVDADGTVRELTVEVGLFAGGRVEVSGDELKAGLDVVVPTR